jgi:hypothetical protein
MKKLALIIFLLAFYGVSKAQNVVDTYPSAKIFAINYQTGQEIQADGNDAIAFKDAFIDLVNNTGRGRQLLQMAPPRAYAIIKQIDPRNMNGYQLTWQVVNLNRARVLGTFYYNIDQNALYFYDMRARSWEPVRVEGDNLVNLNNCHAYSGFNSGTASVPDLSANNNSQNAPDLSINGNTNGNQGLSSDISNAIDDDNIDDEVTAETAPPALPEYDQPPCPTDGYLWQPGYWAWSVAAADYYWVPGVWLAPPHPGLLWTPGYWGFVGGIYRFHRGYWGASVGFYGGINYGFGYVGVGFVGGEWHEGVFRYNTAVVHVNTTVVHNTYVNNTVIRNTAVVNNRTSFNGQGGVAAKPTAQEQAAMSQQHFKPTADQVAHQQAAVNNKSQFASVNKGTPGVTTQDHITAKPNANNPGGRNFSQKQPNNGGQNSGQGRRGGKQPKQPRQKKQKN